MSGVVGVVAEIKGIVQVMIFMAFTIFILLTTLIGLHNFYENNNKRETKLQDNYFLWKATLIVLIALVIVLTIKGIHNNKENILNYLDSKTENVIEQKINDKMREN